MRLQYPTHCVGCRDSFRPAEQVEIVDASPNIQVVLHAWCVADWSYRQSMLKAPLIAQSEVET